MPRIVATLVVRMESERLPGKTMRMIGEKTLLQHLVDRVRMVDGIDRTIVATPDTQENDVIALYCTQENIPCFRGSEHDVLSRMLGALESEHADVGVQVYGDSPLIDPHCIQECLDAYMREGSYDLVGNDMRDTYPSGMFTETFSVHALRDADQKINDPAIREHGTLFLRQHPELYTIKHIEAGGNLDRPDLHFDIDTEEDLRVAEAIVAHFAPRTDFTLQEMIAFLDEHPEIATLNAKVHRRWSKYHEEA